MKHRILLVDDDPEFVALIGKYLRSKGFDVFAAGTAQECRNVMANVQPNVALIDVKLPDQSGVDLVGEIKAIDEATPVIMISAFGDPKLVVEAMQAGASDYIQKPIDHEELLNKLNVALELREEISIEKELGDNHAIIGKSARTRQLLRQIGKVAKSDAPVLFRGESGTGKSLVAEIIHGHSPRKDKPFVTINCPAIPEHLLESELFGHEKGSFTGAVKEKIGKFELANGGTVFLDEIGYLPLELQVKILRVLQGHEFERVGGLRTIRVDVRIIAATNRNLEQAIHDGRFREDLFYRLNVLPLNIPPLRERREDIPLLVDHFLSYYSRKENKRFETISETILNRLVEYHWPGNIRELQNVIERAVVLGKGPILRLADFTINPAPSAATAPPQEMESITTLKDMEYKALVRALEQSGGNISKTARLLGVGRDTVYRRLRKHKIGLK